MRQSQNKSTTQVIITSTSLIGAKVGQGCVSVGATSANTASSVV